MPLEVPLPTHTVHCLTWGPDDGPLALLLHGFPDTAHTWRHLGPELAAAGWRVVAPFTRGYAPTGLPSDGCYTVGALAADAVALHRELGGDHRAVLVGHDWGAITATTLAAHPDSPFARVVALAVPPIGAMNPRRGALRPWLGAVVRQPFHSWYIAFNQVPGLAERGFDRYVARLWGRWSPGYAAAEDLAHLKAAVPDAERARAVLSYYRAFLRPGPGAKAYRAWMRTLADLPRVPLLYLQGADDGCLDRRFFTVAATAPGIDARDGHRFDLVPATGHFLQLEDPGHVNRLVLGFVGAAAPARP